MCWMSSKSKSSQVSPFLGSNNLHYLLCITKKEIKEKTGGKSTYQKQPAALHVLITQYNRKSSWVTILAAWDSERVCFVLLYKRMRSKSVEYLLQNKEAECRLIGRKSLGFHLQTYHQILTMTERAFHPFSLITDTFKNLSEQEQASVHLIIKMSLSQQSITFLIWCYNLLWAKLLKKSSIMPYSQTS